MNRDIYSSSRCWEPHSAQLLPAEEGKHDDRLKLREPLARNEAERKEILMSEPRNSFSRMTEALPAGGRGKLLLSHPNPLQPSAAASPQGFTGDLFLCLILSTASKWGWEGITSHFAKESDWDIERSIDCCLWHAEHSPYCPAVKRQQWGSVGPLAHPYTAPALCYTLWEGGNPAPMAFLPPDAKLDNYHLCSICVTAPGQVGWKQGMELPGGWKVFVISDQTTCLQFILIWKGKWGRTGQNLYGVLWKEEGRFCWKAAGGPSRQEGKRCSLDTENCSSELRSVKKLRFKWLKFQGFWEHVSCVCIPLFAGRCFYHCYVLPRPPFATLHHLKQERNRAESFCMTFFSAEFVLLSWRTFYMRKIIGLQKALGWRGP